jgi:hypothetical protein
VNEQNQNQKGCLAIVIVIGIIVFGFVRHFQHEKEGEKLMIAFSDAKGFWRGEVKQAADGYLLTQKQIPLRAIARRPNVPMFASKDQGAEESFRQVMNPWRPYYVYLYDPVKGALRVGEQARLKEEDALWVLEADVYCWTTREVLNIEQPLPLYETLDDAKADKNRIRENYIFRYADHVEGRPGEGRVPVMAALPVLRREDGKYWSFIRPDPEPDPARDRPYQVCWIHWEGNDPSVSVRLRITRPEFEEYTGGLQKLLYDWTYGSSEDKSKAHEDMIRSTQRNITGEKDENRGKQFSTTDLQTRTQGIPHPTGILVSGILNELQADNVKKRLKECLVMGLDRALWNKAEIAYLEVDRIP